MNEYVSVWIRSQAGDMERLEDLALSRLCGRVQTFLEAEKSALPAGATLTAWVEYSFRVPSYREPLVIMVTHTLDPAQPGTDGKAEERLRLYWWSMSVNQHASWSDRNFAARVLRDIDERLKAEEAEARKERQG